MENTQLIPGRLHDSAPFLRRRSVLRDALVLPFLPWPRGMGKEDRWAARQYSRVARTQSWSEYAVGSSQPIALNIESPIL
jgi:hypothetical protein